MRHPFIGMLFVFTGYAATGASPLEAQRTVAADVSIKGDVGEELWARPVTIDVNRVPLKRAIDAVAASAKVPVQYRSTVVDAYPDAVTAHLAKVPLRVALEKILANTTLRVVADGPGQLMVVETMRGGRGAQVLGGVTGRVIDAKTRKALRGATVVLDKMNRGVQTGTEGEFRLTDVGVGEHRLMVRLLGYTRQVATVVVSENQAATVEIAMEPSVNALDQVVVTGTVVATELRAVPNAMTVITAKQIEERGITRIDQLFRGDVPGLFVVNTGAGNSVDNVNVMFSRGASTLRGTGYSTNPIKTYVDGVEMADPSYMSQIDPRSIERIEILTGPQASTIYGSNALNGVMQIFTKRGTASRPQIQLNLMSGLVENNFSRARTPQHDYVAQVSSVEGRISYNAGGSWNYMGAWAPSKLTARMGAFGGARLTMPTGLGAVTTDVTVRRTSTKNRSRGPGYQNETHLRDIGLWSQVSERGLDGLNVTTLTGQTMGFTLGFSPVRWWSHEFSVGQDAETAETFNYVAAFRSPSDTGYYGFQNSGNRRSLRYTTTAQVLTNSFVQATVTLGADTWQGLTTETSATTTNWAAPISGANLRRVPTHNTGGFWQTQIGFKDQLFLTYGLRAEWNPNFGEDAQPNLAPRYGMAFTQDVGPVTAKVRASYGRSTRPPNNGVKKKISALDVFGPTSSEVKQFGNFDRFKANPELGPEHQQGGEAGLELYLGTRASLVITRYNQTVNDLIFAATVDSVRSFAPNPTFYGLSCATWLQIGFAIGCSSVDSAGFGYLRQQQYINIGSIRNQGWEVQGNFVMGPVSARGTYSWTRSRSLGVYPKYQSQFPSVAYPQFQKGASFNFLPEHTWATGVTYARGNSSVSFNVTGNGQLKGNGDGYDEQYCNARIRLQENRQTVTTFCHYGAVSNGYALTDVVATHRFTTHMEGVLQMENIMNKYQNDLSWLTPVLGRRTKFGFRVRL